MNPFKASILILILVGTSISNATRSGERRFLKDYTHAQGTDVRTSLFPEFHESSSMQHLGLLSDAAKASDAINKYVADNTLNNIQSNQGASNNRPKSGTSVFGNNLANPVVVEKPPFNPPSMQFGSGSAPPQVPFQRSFEPSNGQASQKWDRRSARHGYAAPSDPSDAEPVRLEENEWLYDTCCRPRCNRRRCC